MKEKVFETILITIIGFIMMTIATVASSGQIFLDWLSIIGFGIYGILIYIIIK